MFRAALRSAPQRAAGSLSRASLRSAPRRFASTSSPADKPRSWKSSALRWALAGFAVYYYNNSQIFAEEAPAPNALIPAPSSFNDSELPTVEAVIEEKRKQLKSQPQDEPAKSKSAGSEPEKKSKNTSKSDEQPKSESQSSTAVGSPEALEEEASQEGAFNPETGEINWDCPCLGGMAHGPCGEEFKTAFSCFVYSTEEPKGMDCIDKFQGMQECFRKYPDVYGAELADDDMPEDENSGSPQPTETEPQALRKAPTEDKSKASDTERLAVRESPAQEKPEPTETEHQALREATVQVKLKDNKPETHNLPGVRPLEQPERPPWEDATSANSDKVKPEEKKTEAAPKAEKEAKVEQKTATGTTAKAKEASKAEESRESPKKA